MENSAGEETNRTKRENNKRERCGNTRGSVEQMKKDRVGGSSLGNPTTGRSENANCKKD